jgi:hypothetical protein
MNAPRDELNVIYLNLVLTHWVPCPRCSRSRVDRQFFCREWLPAVM